MTLKLDQGHLNMSDPLKQTTKTHQTHSASSSSVNLVCLTHQHYHRLPLLHFIGVFVVCRTWERCWRWLIACSFNSFDISSENWLLHASRSHTSPGHAILFAPIFLLFTADLIKARSKHQNILSPWELKNSEICFAFELACHTNTDQSLPTWMMNFTLLS